MTKLVTGLMFLCLSLFAEPEWTRSYEQAKDTAFKEHKAIMIMLSKEHCHACWYMENVVFKEESVSTLIMENFVPVYIDIHKDVVPDGFDYIGTPTFYFVDAQGEKLSPRMDGASNVKEFRKKINTILNK